MKIRRRMGVTAALVLLALLFTLVLFFNLTSGGPDRVWTLVAADGSEGAPHLGPDGEEVPHISFVRTTGCPQFEFSRPGRVQRFLCRVGVLRAYRIGGWVSCVGTGREEERPSGVWREYRVVSPEEYGRARKAWKASR